MSALGELLNSNPIPTLRAMAWAIVAFLGAFIFWLNFAELDEVAVLRGEVIPQGKVKVIQHLEGGIVQSIFIAEGAVVKEGDPLLQLELATTALNREEIQIRLDALVLGRARFEAEANGTALKFSAEESQRRPILVRAEREAFEARQQEFNSAMAGLQEQIRQREHLVRELETTRRARVTDLRLSREKMKISESLLEGSLTPRIEHIQLVRDVEKLEGEIAIIDQSIPRAVAGVNEGRERLKEERLKFRRQALDELGKVEAGIARTRELLTEASGQVRRAEIRSPTDGVIKNLRHNTIGGVVRAGEPIMEIVPANVALVVEAKLSPTDRGFVRVGQRAMVKISTYEYSRYGGLEGRVAQIGADSNVDQGGAAYFKVIVETDKSHLGEDPDQFPVFAGMEAAVDIHTGTRSVFDYFIRPVLKLRHEGFRER
ncbi:MAG: HlyD family type I secretion periplasmic adaptor subunit [Pseudomonadota bacterium]